jgi:hypothetical protein
MVTPVAPVSLVNPVTAQIPSFALQTMQAQRQQQLAAALQQQGMAPLDYDPHGRASWTQGLAKVLQAGLGGYLGNKSMEQQAGLQTQGMQAMGAAYGMGQQPAPAPSSGPSPQALGAALDPRAAAALAQGGQQGSLGPTVANAARMDAMPAAAPAPAPMAPGMGGVQTPLNPYGAPPMLVYMASQGDPAAQEQLKTFMANQQMTDAQRNARDPLIGASTIGNVQTQNMTPLQKLQFARAQAAPGSPQAQQLDAAIAKENYIAPIDAKPGTPVLDPLTLQPRFFAPKTADGIGLNFQNPLAPTAYALPGYAGANAGIAGAEQGAKSANTIMPVTGPDGSTVPAWGGPAARAGGAQLGLGGAGGPPVPAQPGAPGSARPSSPGAAPALAPQSALPAPRLGQSTQAQAVQKAGADVLAQAPAQVAQSKQTVTGLETALGLLQGIRATGPGTLDANHMNALMNNLGIPIGKNNTENLQALQKYLANSLNVAAQGTGASGSDARFDSFMHGQPNADAMDKAPLEGAIRYVLSQHDANIARGNFIQQASQAAAAKGDPTPVQTAQQQWGQMYQPQFFAFNRMSAPDQQAFLRAQGAKAPAFVKSYTDYGNQTGWVR